MKLSFLKQDQDPSLYQPIFEHSFNIPHHSILAIALHLPYHYYSTSSITFKPESLFLNHNLTNLRLRTTTFTSKASFEESLHQFESGSNLQHWHNRIDLWQIKPSSNPIFKETFYFTNQEDAMLTVNLRFMNIIPSRDLDQIPSFTLFLFQQPTYYAQSLHTIFGKFTKIDWSIPF